MTEAHSARPVEVTNAIIISVDIDEPPRPAHVEASQTLSDEASAARQIESTELSRTLPTIAAPDGTAEQFVVDIASRGLTDYSVAFRDGARVDYADGRPRALTGQDGATSKFHWEGGRLSVIELPDGSNWQFQNGKWQHSDSTGKPGATADGLPFQNGGETGLVTGPVTEAALRRLNNGYLAPPELSDRSVAARTAAATTDAPLSLSPETLTAAVDSLSRGINDRDRVEATLRAIPSDNKQQFEQLYRMRTNRDLRWDLRIRGMDLAVNLLSPQEEVRHAAWLTDNLASLSRIGTGSTERAMVEHNIRLNLRGLSDTDREALSQQLKQKTGRDLLQTLSESALSAPSRQIAAIYASNGNNLNPGQLQEIAGIALNSNASGEQKLFMIKEAFSGDSDTAGQARREFLGADGEARLLRVFGNNDQFKQAHDYARLGRLDTATFIDLQRSRVADSDKGVELVLRLMTPDQRQLFFQGQRLVQSGKTESANANETEAARYYQRVHESLVRASDSLTSPSRWSGANRSRVVTNWEDIAAHGEQTLIGRLASASGRVNLINAITNFSERDQALMSDPVYRKQVWDMLGGPPASEDNKVYVRTMFSGIETEAGREQLAKVFPENSPAEVSSITRRPALAEASENAVRFERREPFTPHGPDFTFEALMHARPEDYTALSGEQRRMLNARVNLIPEGAREAAKEMLVRLQAGNVVQPGVPEQLYLAALQNASRQSIAQTILEQPEQAQKDSRMEGAARFAFGEDFDKYGKSVLEGRGITAEQLLDINTQTGLIWNSIDQNNYYNGLKFINREQREQILSAADKASNNDPEARRYLGKTFRGLSVEQREVAINVLRSPNQEFTLADQIRAKSLGANIDQQPLIDGYARMTPQERLGQINDYAARYKRFLVDDFSKSADENQRRQIELSLPMSRGDLERAFRDSVRDTARGVYGNTAISEISIGEAQNRFQAQLIDRLPLERQEQAQQDINKAFERYVQAIRENSEAKDQYARDLSEKVMLAVTVVGGGLPIGTTMVRLALTTATAVAARGSSEHLIKGNLTRADAAHVAILGAVDGVGMGRASAFKSIFEKSVASAVEAQIGPNATRTVLRAVDGGFQDYVSRGGASRTTLERQLSDHLQRKGVSDPQAVTGQIMDSFRQQALPMRYQEGFAEFPDAKMLISELFQLRKKDVSESAVARGLISQQQTKDIGQMVEQALVNFTETPALRQQALNEVKWLTGNLRFIMEGATSPEHARAYADVFLMASRHRSIPVPLEALRSASPTTLIFYRDQMSRVLRDLKPPGADSKGGVRYEYAMQREIMDAISRSNNPELRNWVFIPGVGGSTADHAGVDGALVSIKDGAILPFNLKNSQGLAKSYRLATHIEGRTPGLNFDSRWLYDARGRLVEDARPTQVALESHLVGMTRRPEWVMKPDVFAEFNPSSRIRFPSLGDAPEPGDLAGLRAQAESMSEFIAQTQKGGHGNIVMMRDRLQDPRNGGLRFVRTEIANLEVARLARIESVNFTRLRTIDPTVTAEEARKIASLKQQFSSAQPDLDLPSDRNLIAAQRSFDRLGMTPTQADFIALSAAKTPSDIERVVIDNMVGKMSGLLDDLARSKKPGEPELATWSELFRNRQTGAVDRDMLREIARDNMESRQLKAVINLLFARYAPKQRQAAVDRAIDRLATL